MFIDKVDRSARKVRKRKRNRRLKSRNVNKANVTTGDNVTKMEIRKLNKECDGIICGLPYTLAKLQHSLHVIYTYMSTRTRVYACVPAETRARTWVQHDTAARIRHGIRVV